MPGMSLTLPSPANIALMGGPAGTMPTSVPAPDGINLSMIQNGGPGDGSMYLISNSDVMHGGTIAPSALNHPPQPMSLDMGYGPAPVDAHQL